MSSPANSGSIPDDTPSLQGSQASSLPLRPGLSPRSSLPRTPSGALQPFDRRFSSRFSNPSASPSPSPRAASPAFLSPRSRQVSISSQLPASQTSEIADTPDAPWDVVRWTKLKKLTGQAFSEVGKRNFGTPTCLAVTSVIVIGTTKGLILIFDYHQVLKSIIGQGTKAVESGAITSLAIAADHSTIAGGHATGNIFTWEISRPARPFLHIPPAIRTDGQAYDGHLPGRSVLHIGFLGTRHTALVSADDGGMAFSHLATRGLGAVTRTVKTTRLLGRYPVPQSPEKPKQKPSSVLAFAPLPLGNVEQLTDDMGLTALLTPYLLVIVSTTPIAQTQHKASRPKDVHAHGAMSGCLAWFPSVRLKTAKNGKENSDTKLVYCWSNVLTVLDVEVREVISESGKEKPPSLSFHPRSRWRCDEAIVAVQWLSRSVLGVLTISQQMIILEDPSLHVMESVDLLQKQIYHRDFFSTQLHQVVEQTDNENSDMHGVVADAFFQSFKVYKGRIFLLGVSHLSIGVVSNWADRLTALLEHSDNVAAIRLARSYWTGESGGVTVGLPEDPTARHALVGERLLELITASVRYTLFEAQEERPLHTLVAECFDACVTMNEQDFLFDQVYEPFKDATKESAFLEILETYIMDDDITSVPPPVVKDLVELFVDRDQTARLEEVLCRLDPRTFDIDQITTLCKLHYLYDALIFVWNEALMDYVTPLMDLLALVRDTKDLEIDEQGLRGESARKIFPYLAFALTGRKYPQGDFIDEDEAEDHKATLYKNLFADQYVPWPTSTSPPFITRLDGSNAPSFPYLRLLLEYDAASFMSMMSEAFEDPFLNGPQDDNDTPTTNGNRVKITRQYIVSILLNTMSDSAFTPEHTIYLDMFIARNLPKYPQFMILSGSQLQQVLDRLCSFRSDDLDADCQLSVEYLLSVYHPPVTPSLIEQLREARFYRVLKSLYRSEQRSLDLIRTYFEDPYEKQETFRDLSDCLKSETLPKQVIEVKQLVLEKADQLAAINTPQTAKTLARYAPDILDRFSEALKDTYHQFIFLRTILEPSRLRGRAGPSVTDNASDEMTSQFCEKYVQLMCIHDPRHVADYIGLLSSGDLNLDRVLPAMESNGVIDAAVLLLAQDGLAGDAIARLCAHMKTLGNALCGLISAAASAPDRETTEETANDLTSAVDKYARLGIWLCQGQTTVMRPTRRPRHRTNAAWQIKESDLDFDEQLWLNLIDAVVSLAKSITNALRSTVQSTFTALLVTTSSTPGTSKTPAAQRTTNQSFLYIFRAFLARASSSYAPTLSDLRKVLLDIFTAYAHESSVLSLASSLLDSDVFTEVSDIHTLRQRGWRPKTQVCELCKRRAWGTGTSISTDDPNHGESLWREWECREQERLARKVETDRARSGEDQLDRGKGKRPSVHAVEERTDAEKALREKGTLVVFACRHVFHRHCLDERIRMENEVSGDEREGYWCPLEERKVGA
ncbi:Golgi CORVET complex core vacuolar protein 8-domain-containing protein [Delphinella strobiligena]|nr:Golgi CORVET complex core vacuolar protein 8-domain-containing protein [Delphinella strobiligena]